jgi:mannose-6-phosphate isomerase-like protein (cupin superfamily)
MHRRSFLKAATAAIPAIGLHDFLTAQAPAQSATTPPNLHVVAAGEDRSGHPHTLGFSSIFFKVSGTETGGRLFIIEHPHLVPGGPPLHLHLNQEEWFYVMEGEVAFQVGEQRLQLRAGESVLAPRLVPHTFSSVSATPSRMMIAFCPTGKMEQFFHDGESNPAALTAEFMSRYDMEMIGPSPFWKT